MVYVYDTEEIKLFSHVVLSMGDYIMISRDCRPDTLRV